MFGRLSWCASAKRRGSAWAEARCSLDFSLGSHKRERARELARESRPRPVSPPAGHAHRAHCGTTRFLILSRLAEGGHFRELCLPPPPPRSFRLRPEILSLWRLLVSAVESQDKRTAVKNVHRLHAGDLPAQAQPPRTQTRVALRRPLLRPDGRLAAAGARPRRCRVRTSHASQTLQFLRPRSSRLRLSHLRSHTSPPRPRSAQARHKSDPHRPPKARRPQRRGRLHRLQARRPLRRPSGTASSCATTRTSSSPRDQTCSSTRAHLAPRAASPARPPLSNSSLRAPRRLRRSVDDHPIQSLLDCFKQKLGLTASMCHSVLAQALSESMIQPARCALARPALARAPPLTACPSAQVNPPAGSDGNITFRLSLLASLSPVCLRPIANRLRRSWTPPPSTTSPTAQWSNLQRFPMSKRWCAQIRTQQLWMHRRSASKIPFPTAAPPQENRCLWKHISFRSRSSARSAFSWTRAFSRGRTSSRFGRATQLPARAVRAPHQLVAM